MREQDKYLCKVVVSEIDEYYGEVLNNSWEYANEVKPSVMFILDADIREAIFQNICESVCWDNLCIELTREYDIKKPYHQWELSDYFQFFRLCNGWSQCLSGFGRYSFSFGRVISPDQRYTGTIQGCE